MSKRPILLLALPCLLLLAAVGCGTDLTSPRLAKMSDLEGTWKASQYTLTIAISGRDSILDALAGGGSFQIHIGPDRGDGSASATITQIAGGQENQFGSMFRVSGSQLLISNSDGTGTFPASYVYTGNTLQLDFTQELRFNNVVYQGAEHIVLQRAVPL